MTSVASIARVIDHTLLKPEATEEQIRQLCREARQYEFYSVCINPLFVPLAVAELEGTNSKVCTVVGFPMGATASRHKAAEAAQAIAEGATEIDMVIPVGLLKGGQHTRVYDDIATVQTVCRRARDVLLKVILETCMLTDAEKHTGARLAEAAGAAFVKTSTGFAGEGATTEDVRLLRKSVSAHIQVKAAGGIRTYAQAQAMLAAGAARLGTSNSVSIVRE